MPRATTHSTGVSWVDALEPYFPVPRTSQEAGGPRTPEYRSPAVGGYMAHPALPPHPSVGAVEALKQFLRGRQGFVWTEDMSPAEREGMLRFGPAHTAALERAAMLGAPAGLVGLQRNPIPAGVDPRDPDLRRFQALDYVAKLLGLLPGSTAGVLSAFRALPR